LGGGVQRGAHPPQAGHTQLSRVKPNAALRALLLCPSIHQILCSCLLNSIDAFHSSAITAPTG
jgi:hypothetical protein